MRVVVLIMSAVLALSGGATSLADAKSDSARPVIRITQLAPLVVAGERFRAGERVAIRVATASDTHVRRLRTSRRGTFTARFAAVTRDRCGGGLSVVATAASGPVAKTRMPQPLCPPVLRPPGMP